jgi:tRNA (guanine37-N1)-methyltransferase
MQLDIITIFPEYFAPLGVSLIGRAVQRGDIVVGVHDLRSWAHDPHRTVDDTPFGGGPGMVMRPEPWGEAIDAVLGGADGRSGPADGAPAAGGAQLIVPTPSGEIFSQAIAAELARADHLIFACGRYEGIDARVADYARSLTPV